MQTSVYCSCNSASFIECSLVLYRIPSISVFKFRRFELLDKFKFSDSSLKAVGVVACRMNKGPSRRKIPKNLLYPRRPKLPPELGTNKFVKKKDLRGDKSSFELISDEGHGQFDESDVGIDDGGCLNWSDDEVDAISSLFQGRILQKPWKLSRERPLPLPTPYKIRPLGLPTTKRYVRCALPRTLSSRSSLCKQIYKKPEFLVGLARQIRELPLDSDASEVLDQWRWFLRKGSLSLTIRELGHMGLPERALQTFCWAQKHPQLFPDDRILASTVEILARTQGLKMPFNLDEFMSSASRSVIEAMARGLIRAGSFGLARKLLLVAKDTNRALDPSIYAKMILELAKYPDRYKLMLALLDELAEMDDLNMKQQDCTAIMKVCIRLGKFETVESLFHWFKGSGRVPSVVMYTTLMYGRYYQKKYREALAVVWEMEESNCLLDLPAYRVIIKVCVSMDDISRSARYFSKLKEAGFAPSYDIYCEMIKVYAVSGRWAKVRQIFKELELTGLKLDKEMESFLSQVEKIRFY